MLNEITVTVNAREGRLLWSDLKRAIEENIGALNAMARSLTDRDALPGSWRVEGLAMNSPATATLLYEAPADFEIPSVWIPMFVDGIRQLETREVQPEGFTDEVMAKLANLVSLNERIDSIEYRSGGDHIVASAVATAHAAAIHARNRKSKAKHYYAMGELRGLLGQITVHGGTKEFVIYDDLDDHGIPCHFEDDPHEVTNGLAKRVAVYGRVSYDRRHKPVRIEVENWHPLRDAGELASLEAIRAVMAPLPKGQTSEEYVRGLRDDE